MTAKQNHPTESNNLPYQERVNALAGDAEGLELAYQEALKAGESGPFEEAINANYAGAPGNLLYAAWYQRFKYAAAQAKGFAVTWSWVIPLAIVQGLLFWWLSDERYMVTTRSFAGTTNDYIPALILLVGPLSASFMLAYLTAVSRKRLNLGIIIALVTIAAAAYVLLTSAQVGTQPFQQQYLSLMAMHLPLLSWAGVGAYLIFDHRDPANRFAFLIKSFEIFIMAGLFVIAGGLFTGITIALFSALDIDFPELAQRLFVAGGGGLIPVVALAVLYNPTVPPAGQAFDEGLSKLIALLMRILLPLAFFVLLVYIAFIPFNFREPFDNRDVLIIYNGMLFAVIALLVGATPLSLSGLSPRLALWLRRGLIAVAALALIVSIYALAAIVYRTALDRLTPNRLAFIGWNVVNIALLFLLLLFQLRAKDGTWLAGQFRAFQFGTVLYAIWTAAMILLLPWLFGIDQGKVEKLPPTVQKIIYEDPYPVLLKCRASPHIYLLEEGEKRWIDSIATFEDQGFLWRDVQFISCPDLRSIPDGPPIPKDAGPPPEL